MSTFEIKMTILSILGEASSKEKAEELYQWAMEEVELESNEAEVTTLKTVQ